MKIFTSEFELQSDEEILEGIINDGELVDDLGATQLIAAIDSLRFELAEKILDLVVVPKESETRTPLGAALQSSDSKSFSIARRLFRGYVAKQGKPLFFLLPEFTEPLTHVMVRFGMKDKLDMILSEGYDKSIRNRYGECYDDI